jgi:NAD(P)-dependent dehydrogenase (short-subunit alcohol dehydrogenase family)
MPTSAMIAVTGVSRGIGLEIAKRFASEGYKVVGCASSDKSVAEVKRKHPDFDVVKADLSNKNDVRAFCAHVRNAGPRLDVLVNNAGRYLPGKIETEAEDTFEALMALNVGGPYYVTKGLLDCLAPGSTVINVCSTASITAYPNGASYCISKFALLGFSKVLREELKPKGIRVVSLLPGATLTDSWSGVSLPPERFIAAEDLGHIAWLAHSLRHGAVIEEVVIRPLAGDIDESEFD